MGTPSTVKPDETELLLHEILDEASSLAHHPVEEVRRLGHVAAEGDSATTPLLITIGVLSFVAVILAVLLTAAMLAYYYG